MRLAVPMMLLTLAGCVAVTPVAALPYPAVPPPQAEVMGNPPVSRVALVWQPGHWDWTGGSYVWTVGQWVPSAGHGPLWQEGVWSNATGAWTWIPAHWV